MSVNKRDEQESRKLGTQRMASSSSSGKGNPKETPTQVFSSSVIFENKFDQPSKSPKSPVSADGGASSGKEFSESSENKDLAPSHIQNRQLVTDEISRLQEQTHVMDRTLTSLNLPAVLEDLSDRQRIPQSLIEKAQQIKDMGGIQFLSIHMTELSELLQRNREILNECINMIDEEEKSDKQLREQYKKRWNKAPLEELTKITREEIGCCQQLLNAQTSAHRTALETYKKHEQTIELLSKPIEEIEEALISRDEALVSKNCLELRQLLNQVEHIKAVRKGIEKKVKENMNPSADDAKDKSRTILDQIYGPLQKEVDESLKMQESVMSQIQTVYKDLSQKKAADQSGPLLWESRLKELEAGYHRFIKLKTHIEDFSKCINGLTPNVKRQQKNVSDFCLKQKKEKDKFLTDIQKSDASHTHQNQGASNQNQDVYPSPRPPLPERSSSGAPETWPNSQSSESGHTSPSSAPPEPPSEACSYTESRPVQNTGLDNFIRIIWKSKNITNKRRNSVTFLSFQKWCFLLDNMGQRNKIICKLKKINTDIVHKFEEGNIRIEFQCGTTFKHEEEEDCEELKKWRKDCSRIAREVFDDILIVTIGCRYDERNVIRSLLVKQSCSTVDIIESNDCHGICLVGDGESLIIVISEICKIEHFKETNFWDPETKGEIEIGFIFLDLIQIRFLNYLDLEKKLKDQFKSIKTYLSSAENLFKLIGNKGDVRQVKDYLSSKKWIHLYSHKEEDFDEETIEFLSREAVQKFVDNELGKKTMGTWIIADDKKSVFVYGVDDPNVKEVFKTIRHSFQIRKFRIADVRKQERKLHELQKRASEFEIETKGRFCMFTHAELNKTMQKGVKEGCFLCTADLLNDKEIANLMDEMQQVAEKSAKVVDAKLDFPSEVFQFIRKMKKDELLWPGQNVELEIREDNTLILKGDEASVLAAKKYINDLNLVQKSMLLPQSLTLNQILKKIPEEYQCLFGKMQVNPVSRVWFINNIVVMVYLGEPKKDLYVDSKAVLNISEGDTLDRRIITMFIPTSYEGKGKHYAAESFEDAYKKMLAFDIKSLLISMKTEGNWTTKKLVKGLLHPLTTLKALESKELTVILYSSDRNECEAANTVIKDANMDKLIPCGKDQPARIEFEVKASDLTKEKVDVIVNTISTDLNLKSGAVSKSIWTAAKTGAKLEEELKKKNGHKQRVDHGKLLETGSYGLACKKIFHGALVPWNSTEYCEKIMQTFVTSCLEKANEHQFSNLAFPALGTGNLSFPPKVVANLIKKIVRTFEKSHPNTSIKKIVFVIYYRSQHILKEFQEILMKEDKNELEKEEKHNLPNFTGGNGLEEIVVSGREDDVNIVVEKLNQQLLTKRSPKFIRESLEEPKDQKISNRNGTECSDGFGAIADQTHDANENSTIKEAVNEIDDTKHCKIARFKDKKALDENATISKRKHRAIIYPYKEKNDALVIFHNWEDAEEFCKNPGQLEIQDLEQQAVRNIKAEISKECIACFANHNVLEKTLIECSGVCIEKPNENKWILFGNLPQIELAHKCIKDMISHMNKGNQTFPTDVELPRDTKMSAISSNRVQDEKNKQTNWTSLPSNNYSFVPHKNLKCPERTEFYLKSDFKVSLYNMNILMCNVDAICCGQDPSLKSNGRIAKSILENYQDVKKKLSEEKKKKHVFGEVLGIKCNANPSKFFIFVITPSPGSGEESIQKTLSIIKMCFANVLEFANQNKISKLALPLLGTGNRGAPNERVARLWFESVAEFIESKTGPLNLKEVHLVNNDPANLTTVEGYFDEHIRTGTPV